MLVLNHQSNKSIFKAIRNTFPQTETQWRHSLSSLLLTQVFNIKQCQQNICVWWCTGEWFISDSMYYIMKVTFPTLAGKQLGSRKGLWSRIRPNIKKKSYCVGADRHTVYEQTNYQTMFCFLGGEMSCSFLKLVLAVNNAHTDTVPQSHTRLGIFNLLIIGPNKFKFTARPQREKQ